MWVFMFLMFGASAFLWWRNAQGPVGYGGFAAVNGLNMATAVLSLLWPGIFLSGTAYWILGSIVALCAFSTSVASVIIMGIAGSRHGSNAAGIWGAFALMLIFMTIIFFTFIVLAVMAYWRSLVGADGNRSLGGRMGVFRSRLQDYKAISPEDSESAWANRGPTLRTQFRGVPMRQHRRVPTGQFGFQH